MKLALLAIAILIAPLLLLRGRALTRYYALTTGLWAVFAFLALVIKPFGIIVEPGLAFIAAGVINGALLWTLVATADEVRWSASRAAVAVALFYFAAIPTMMQTPTDGDESFYILITESIVHDGDFDLRNQFAHQAASASGRTNLEPQFGDFRGKHGEIYSHLEPFLPLLLVPGYLIAKLPGMLVTLAIFGALLARSTIRLCEDEGIGEAAIRGVFPLIALAPPILFYSVRIWPEVPAAFFFVEAIRGVRNGRPTRWIAALLALVLLKLRFILVAVVLLVRAVKKPKQLAIAALIIAVPLLVAWMFIGSATSVHSVRELMPGGIGAMTQGLFGLVLDAEQGIAFQAPFYLFGIFALGRWRRTPAAFRLGISAAALYIFYLVPRAEWHGGWSPPLRYIVFLMPILALGCAALWESINAGAIAVVGAWTIALVVHGLAFPWRLFHIANGESFMGEALSQLWHTDFSRLFPSFIRMNFAAYVAAIVLVVAIGIFRGGRLMSPVIAAALLVIAFVIGRKPGHRIEFEDAHIEHTGGDLYPRVFQPQRFLYRGGWIVRAGDSMSFLALRGASTLLYRSFVPATIQLGGHAYELPPAPTYASVAVEVDADGRVELRCLSGEVNLDRMDHE